MKVIQYDFGHFTTCLGALKRSFDEVAYFCLHDVSFPRSNTSQVGKGIDGVKWVDSFWDELKISDKSDTLIFFSDCHAGDLQEYLRGEGWNVFGSGKGNELELYRYEANEILGKVWLPKVTQHKIIGIDELRKFLKENEGTFYIKTNHRGDGETWKSESYELSEPKIDALEHELGMMKNEYEFIVCEPIDGDDIVEIGSDSVEVDGKYPQNLMYGYEIKDAGYCSIVRKRSLISKIITEPLDRLAPVFQRYGYRGFFSTEIRVGKDRKPYLTDFTCRCGSPPSELYMNMIKNLKDVMWGAAQGVLVEPEYVAKYGALAIITSEWAEKNWQPVYWKGDGVCLKNWTVIDGVNYYIPINDVEMCEIGAVYAYADTLKGAIDKVKKIEVEGYKVCVNSDSLDEAVSVSEKGKRIGITF